MKKIYFSVKRAALALILLTAGSTATSMAENVVLKAGTPIPMQLVNTVTGKNSTVGQVIDFRVTNDIVVNGKTVIPAGSIAKAQVTRAKKNGIFGQNGEIQVNINSVMATDNTQVVLSGGTINDEGKNKLVLSLFLCWFIKGEAGEIPAGMACSPIVAGNTTINVD